MLSVFSDKGETDEELTQVVDAYHKAYDDRFLDTFTIPYPIKKDRIMDVCGTGGDGKNSLNVSTAVAFVVAGAGIPVVKHGNKGVSSQAGSSDVLVAMGVKVDVASHIMEIALEKANIAFLYAPRYHPRFKEFAPLRAELKRRTVFNLMGPLLNPAHPKRQLVGVFSRDKVLIVAKHLKMKQLKKAMVVHSADGYDELSCAGVNYVAEIDKQVEGIKEYELDAESLGVPIYEGELTGGDAKYNAHRIRQLLLYEGQHDLFLHRTAQCRRGDLRRRAGAGYSRWDRDGRRIHHLRQPRSGRWII